MTPEAQRIAIAEACGWKFHSYNPEANKIEAIACWYRPCADYWQCEILPDFCSDLNAMHEAESVIVNQSLEMEYRETLGDIVGQYQCIWYATADQRAEAFLKTLNLWKS